jgi:hypothetical protein
VSRYLKQQSPYNRSVRAGMDPGRPVEVPRDLAPVRILPSQPGALGLEYGTPVALPGSAFAPAGATPVDQVGDGNIAPGASATLVQIQVPDGQRFRVAGVGFGADDETALGFLTWSMIENNDPQIGYNAVPAPIGSIAQLADIFHLSGSSVLFRIVASSAASAGVTFRFICRVRGWFYATKES